MNSRVIVSLAMATMSLIFSFGCAKVAKKKSQIPESVVSTMTNDGSHYIIVEFAKGKSSLSQKSKQHLIELNRLAQKSRREIKDIKVLAWADKEYPVNMAGATTPEVILAKQRAKNIENYLQKELKNPEQIDSFNMARRPNLLSRVFETEEFKVKKGYEKTGTTAVRTEDGSLAYTKASKALVIIDYDENKK